ncbi:LysR family transcriptional regulator [Noviherbaspirillum sp. CPCC 100848]|uniref:LysR family transcriptional regulator n=1 Tax=Noviherbaspirillum album TaxID=3080276 RepID=A0ABU6JG35_9BURK|nr:LysR family transcriptional regulator [Noviherbaspirillum sp. CPCC 100848]MEC4722503.1 LysR family transcriptional regulator [Noviherbaspirillum sp. CPCC 100848]
MSGFTQFIAFASAARHRSFAHAGRELGITASTVAKRILRLEEQLGVKLFHRTTRQVTLSSDGEALYARCEKILADIHELETLAAGTHGEPRGELRINAPITYGKHVVLPAVSRLLQAHPDLSADVRLTDQLCDVIKDGIDAAVRIMPLIDSRLASKRIGWQHLVVCGSPDYLARRGKPKHPAQMDGHAFIVFRVPTSGRERPLQFSVDGEVLELHPRYRMLIDDGEGMVESACHGTGLIQVPDYMAAESIGSGRLVEVLRDFRPPPLPVSIVWPGNRLLPARVRLLIDALSSGADQPNRTANPRAADSGSLAM